MDAIGDPARRGTPLQCGAPVRLVGACHHKIQVGSLGCNGGEGLDQEIAALPLTNAAEEKKIRPAVQGRYCTPEGCFLNGRVSENVRCPEPYDAFSDAVGPEDAPRRLLLASGREKTAEALLRNGPSLNNQNACVSQPFAG